MATYSTDLAKGLWNLKVDDKYADFTISVNGREFKCHRVILAALSEYFEVMFDSGLEVSYLRQFYICRPATSCVSIV